MNIEKKRWHFFKQNLLTFISLCIFQTVLNFYYPPLTRLGPYLEPVAKIVMSIGCILVYSSIFLFPEQYAYQTNLDFLNVFPNPALVKKLFKGWRLLVISLTALFMWHIKLYHLTTTWYLLLYLHFIMVDFLISHALHDDE